MTQCTKPDALAVQVGGGHYKDLMIQPAEFLSVNRWDYCACLILKYVTRHRSKNGLQDLEKAVHSVALRADLVHDRYMVQLVVSTRTYCQANNLPPEETAVINALGSWVWSNSTRDQMELQVALSHLISTYNKAET